MIAIGERVISKWKDGRSYYFSGRVTNVNREKNTCEISWDDGGPKTIVNFKWIRFSVDLLTETHRDVGKNEQNHKGQDIDWDGGNHRFKDLDDVINSYSPHLKVIEIN